MLRRFKIAPLLMMLGTCAIIGLWQDQGRRLAVSAQQSFAPVSPTSRPHANMTIRVANGSLVVKDLRLQRAGSSTVLKGEVFNEQARRINQATFEVRAYDSAGTLLRGVEEKTIFTVHRLKANASVRLNSGYGVWLQGIALDSIARLEISEIRNETDIASLMRFVPYASHAVEWKRYSEIDE